MFCINCFHKSTTVINSRPHKKQPSVWRRRKCSTCSMVFTTYERPSLAENKPVHRKAKQTETFNTGKLIISIAKAFPHNPQDGETNAVWLAQSVEDVLSTQYKTITPEIIEAVVHHTLRQYDEIAAMQYALQHQLMTSIRKKGRPSLRERELPTDELPSR